MATSKQLAEQSEDRGTDTDLTLCGICLAPIENPKALPCLHTFCLGCIKEWAKGKPDTVKCPVCKEDFPLPPDGVSGFRNNFFVTRLKEKRVLKDEVGKSRITCTFCDESENTAIAWCMDCKENLCTNCVKSHKTLKPLKTHSVCSFDDVKSGKVDVQKTNVTEYCTKHKGQVLWFFCETCGVLICRDCTVVDHPTTKHTLVNVEDISGAQGRKMEELSSCCQKVAKQVDDAIKVANDVENDLTVALQRAKLDIAQITAKVKDAFLLNLKQKEQELINEMTKVGDHHKSQIKIEKDALMSQKSQLKRALDMTAHVTEKGSPYDVAAMYTPLTDTLQRLSDIKPVIVPSTLSEVRVEANEDYHIEVPRLAAVHAVTFEKVQDEVDVKGEWEVEKQFGKEANLQSGMAIAVYPTGDIAVADNITASVKVFNPRGQLKHTINTKTDSQVSYPSSVAISSDGTTYVTDWSRYVKVFDTNATFVNKFEIKAPPTCMSKDAKLYGMAIDGNNQLIVGECTSNYVSIHKLSGDHINSFKVTISPYCISAAPENAILITNYSSAQLLTHTGQLLYTLDSPPIQGMSWCPTRAHFFSNSEFLLVCQNHSGKPGGIYHYSTKGMYLGQIAKEVTDPAVVTITRDGNLLVLKRTYVEVFKKK